MFSFIQEHRERERLARTGAVGEPREDEEKQQCFEEMAKETRTAQARLRQRQGQVPRLRARAVEGTVSGGS